MGGFVWPIRVYYEDTDSGGVVYYANYLKFMERARTEWLRELGFEQDVLRDENGIIFAVRSVQVDYLRPGRFNDLLEVSAELYSPDLAAAGNRHRRVSIQLLQRVRRGEEVLCEAVVKVASLDAGTLRPRPMPARLLERLNEMMS